MSSSDSEGEELPALDVLEHFWNADEAVVDKGVLRRVDPSAPAFSDSTECVDLNKGTCHIYKNTSRHTDGETEGSYSVTISVSHSSGRSINSDSESSDDDQPNAVAALLGSVFGWGAARKSVSEDVEFRHGTKVHIKCKDEGEVQKWLRSLHHELDVIKEAKNKEKEDSGGANKDDEASSDGEEPKTTEEMGDEDEEGGERAPPDSHGGGEGKESSSPASFPVAKSAAADDDDGDEDMTFTNTPYAPTLPSSMLGVPDASTFKVRGKTYLDDGNKQECDPALFTLCCVDLFHTGDKTINVCGREDNRVHLAAERGEDTWYFVMNLMIPVKKGKFFSYVVYWCGDRSLIDADTPFGRIARPFFTGDDDVYRNDRFKLIPKIVEGPYVFCSILYSSCSLTAPAFSDTTWHKSNHHTHPLPPLNQSSIDAILTFSYYNTGTSRA
jgi:hypothetical protein